MRLFCGRARALHNNHTGTFPRILRCFLAVMAKRVEAYLAGLPRPIMVPPSLGPAATRKRSVKETGIRNGAFGAETFGFSGLKAAHWNLTEPALYEHALRAKEGELAYGGALVAETGVHTGRSPKDKFIVRDALTDKTVWWDNNGAITPEQFQQLHDDFIAHAKGKALFAQDLYGGADRRYRINTRVYTELAWHSLFIRTLLIRPERGELKSFVPDLTIVDLPSFKADPERHGVRSETIIAIDFSRKIVLIGGTSYAGEMKKSVFTTLNYFLPNDSVMPMHCSANVGPAGDTALFFGLSGTGKTTLSADPKRTLLGDDEHGWGPQGVFNFEGGCYAKTIMLTADAFGVMPPIAKLTSAQAMYHFLSGYTTKVAGTEKGVKDPEATFSTCFGAPFMPRHPSEYGNLLRELIAAHGVDCWLVNTGWTGGKYGVGRRMPIHVTRTLLTAALDGSLKSASFRTDPYFGFAVPTSVPGVEPHLLYPSKTWRDKAEFDQTARKLVAMFQENFVKFEPHVGVDVRQAAPEVRIAAE